MPMGRTDGEQATTTMIARMAEAVRGILFLAAVPSSKVLATRPVAQGAGAHSEFSLASRGGALGLWLVPQETCQVHWLTTELPGCAESCCRAKIRPLPPKSIPSL
jgi:hypothetical protein